MTMNLKKYITLLTIFFGIIVFSVIFPKSVSAGEWANPNQTCTQYCSATGGRTCINTQNISGSGQTVESSCSSSFPPLSCSFSIPSQTCCTCQGAAPPRNPCASFPQFPVYCPANNRCIPAGYDCATQTSCGGRQWYCPSGYRINCGPPVTCQSTAAPTPTPRPSVCVPNSIRNVCSTTSCSL